MVADTNETSMVVQSWTECALLTDVRCACRCLGALLDWEVPEHLEALPHLELHAGALHLLLLSFVLILCWDWHFG